MSSKNAFFKSIVYAVSSEDTVNSFKKLYGNKNANEKIIEYYTKKLKLSAAVLFIGILGYFIYPYVKSQTLTSPYEVNRNDYGGGSRTVSINYRFQNGEDKKLELTVDERKYTDEELEKLYKSFEKELEKTILNKNKSFDHVTSDLEFASQIKNYPFIITYKTDKPAILSFSGKIDHSKITEETGEPVMIIITARYEDFRKEIYLPVNICEKDLTGEEKLYEDFENELKESDEKSKYSEHRKLPSEVNGIKIQYFEKGENIGFVIPVIALVFAIVLFAGNNDDLKKEVKNRDMQLASDYPILINKFAVFYNAGMPINAIWNKLCSEYEKDVKRTGRQKYLYEEMLITRTMINDGKNEIEAYEDFAKRCSIRQYKVFVSLLQQAIVKGKDDMGELLKKEVDEVFTERKNNAKKLSEEASSKLLLPMFMMLIVVMIMIMFPAFRSFN